MKVLILAGGVGKRLWPLSSESCPKQFKKILNSKTSLFQDSVLRAARLTGPSDIFVVSNESCKKLIEEQLAELNAGFSGENIIIEPDRKNTLAAIYYGVKTACKDKDDNVVVFPSDHKLGDINKMVQIIKETGQLAENNIVVFGIKPGSPHTGYGYISPGKNCKNGFLVREFKEKPDRKQAEEYIAQGYLWNSGIFMMNSKVFAEETKKYSPEIFNAFEKSENITDSYKKITNSVSIDKGIMEKTKKSAVVPIDVDWNDLGSFSSIYDAFEKDCNNNVSCNNEKLINSRGNLIISEKKKDVVIMGVNDMIVVDNDESLLICEKSLSDKINK